MFDKTLLFAQLLSFQVVNHGIPDEVITGIKQDIQNFFQLPLKVKNEYAQRLGDLQGYGQVFFVSDDQKLEWGDRFALFIQPTQARDMSYWPSQPHTFRLDFVCMGYLNV